jgi:hypothetical protein
MAADWFYILDGKNIVGPVSSAQLRALARSGKLGPTDMVLQDGMAKWTPASAIKGLFNPVLEAAPVKQRARGASPAGAERGVLMLPQPRRITIRQPLRLSDQSHPRKEAAEVRRFSLSLSLPHSSSSLE